MAARVPDPLRAATHSARDRLLDAFRGLDVAQQGLARFVDSVTPHLVDQRARTQLQTHAGQLDQDTDELIARYLTTLDLHPLEDEQDPRRWAHAQEAFLRLTDPLLEQTRRVEDFAVDHRRLRQEAEEQVSRHRAAIEEVEAALRRAGSAIAGPREEGLRSDELDSSLSSARAAVARVHGWTALDGGSLDDLVAQAVTQLEAAADAASALDEAVRGAAHRRASLATLLESVETRLGGRHAPLSRLRRDFSLGNFADLEVDDEKVLRDLAQARTLLGEFDRAESDGDWGAQLTRLTAVGDLLDRAAMLVDGPHDRLELLAEMRRRPRDPVQRAEFAVRDARLLVRQHPRGGTTRIARALDLLAGRAAALVEELDVAHPNYWEVHSEAQRIRDEVARHVADYRALPD